MVVQQEGVDKLLGTGTKIRRRIYTGKDWYAGAINNSKDRRVTVPLSFLLPGNYTAELSGDSSDCGFVIHFRSKN